MYNKIVAILCLSLLGNYITTGENKKITFKRLDSKETHPDNIVYSYNQGIDFINQYPSNPNLPKNQIEVSNFLQGPIKNFLDKTNITSMNLLRMIRQNCMINPTLFSNALNEQYVDGDTALLVTMNSKNFNNMDQVVEECQKNKINPKEVVLLDISSNNISRITVQDLSIFQNLQALLINNNNLNFIDIVKNPLLSVLACQNNQLTKVLNIMQIMKQRNTPSFVNCLENPSDDNEHNKVVHFITVAEGFLKDGAEIISYYNPKDNARTTLPLMIFSKNKKNKIDFFKLGHISTTTDDNLGEFLIFDKGIIKNHIINKKFKVTGFRNFFKKHSHNELNYPQKAIKRFLVISLICNLIKKSHILNFVHNHDHENLSINEILTMLEEFMINQNNNKNN